MDILGLILARKGSERFPGKNRMDIGGTPMVDFAIDAILETPSITSRAISTDDEVLGQYCVERGVRWINRPADICTSTSDISEAIEHAQGFYDADYIVSFQCAVPLRPAGSTVALVQEVLTHGARGGLSVIKRSPWMWHIESGVARKWWADDRYPRSQDMVFDTYEELNSIQVTHRSVIGRRWGYPMSFVVLPEWCHVDIDDEDDYRECQTLWPYVRGEYYIPRCYPTFTVQSENNA